MYLNANVLEAKQLAKKMNKTIHRKSKYYEFFKWHHYYSFHYPDASPDSDHICTMCSIFNIIKQTQLISTYEQITEFWDMKKK